MRSLVCFFILAGCSLLTACSDGSSSTNSSGGAGGSDTTTATDGGGGAGGTSTTTDTTTTTTTDTTTTTTTTTMTDDGCANAGSDPISFASDIQPIFSSSCGDSQSCHLKAIPAETLSLKAGQAYNALVGVKAKQTCHGQKRVEPSSASGSYLVNKITDKQVCGMNDHMPPKTLLPSASRNKIIDWICQGALNN